MPGWVVCWNALGRKSVLDPDFTFPSALLIVSCRGNAIWPAPLGWRDHLLGSDRCSVGMEPPCLKVFNLSVLLLVELRFLAHPWSWDLTQLSSSSSAGDVFVQPLAQGSPGPWWELLCTMATQIIISNNWQRGLSSSFLHSLAFLSRGREPQLPRVRTGFVTASCCLKLCSPFQESGSRDDIKNLNHRGGMLRGEDVNKTWGVAPSRSDGRPSG